MKGIEDLESLRAARDDRRVGGAVDGPVHDIGARIGERRWIDPDRSGERRART